MPEVLLFKVAACHDDIVLQYQVCMIVKVSEMAVEDNREPQYVRERRRTHNGWDGSGR